MRYQIRRTTSSENLQVRRRLYSQNYLRSPKLITKLIRNSSIGKNDTVLEIGAGRGIITQELVKFAGKVIAVEIDDNLYRELNKKFYEVRNCVTLHCNILDYNLPQYPYKVFANIPFIITADIIRKLTFDNNFQEGYLVVQNEAAKKFIGKPLDHRNQMMATLLKPWFDISLFWRFEKSDFVPTPKINTTMIRISKVTTPLINKSYAMLYRDFVLYKYSRSKVAKLNFDQFLKMFNSYVYKTSDAQKMVIANYARKILRQQKGLEKIHRTRLDKHWRKF
ncbi:hypothetical protein A3A76_04770 [Candidatus Woesebacteria bacterium RIFCSPLOWO2_01_FULL_39_23]|uniref:rRNA (Adenine-N(6)-)-methyltransferase, 16S rRNA (Adenine1518-N6/adenine1519-N6)-dimethyltransferase n=2 Tax=Microgenomates group TaxID=1794810 RepID=A0A0H4TNL1_9BACT|nr:rRNA (adenine-N(6)-)-methyltransferase, 16S rRNA (adenine1518-N6/adenine1519-N6)-dimethyltransferase [uncultured Microgenomates bacterium Rifle_16ft_4_minimus_37633]OGM13796.1 MAG: hypothetical protein A2141_03995 [Candidatus Woesebacteria bacterium RBG_16_40_11]OGM27746.1 MAG: hypothetical protein A2628_04990 [Candidatus Woesebacteria bacterium RIFCSPHIGHO2_01_FULL_40_22]OGM36012.1 MAG: hypothetical protein A3E41_01245 [Candidatus Woesebacteria bacterium RIFCSPHIGHO2_12_FULL_38_9]OGM62168.1